MKIYIHPDKGNGWLNSTLTFYPGVDGEGYSLPQVEITTAQLDQTTLVNFSVVVGYFVQLGGGIWDAKLVIAEPGGQAIVTPAVMDGEVEVNPAVLRDVINFAVTVRRNSDGAERTDTMTTEELPIGVRNAALAVWENITQ